MTKTRIAAIVAAATLGAAAFTGAAVALAANDTPTPSARESAPSRGMDGQGRSEQSRGESGMRGPGGFGPGGFGPGGHGPGGFGPGGHGPGERGPEGHMLHSEGVVESTDGSFVTVRMQLGEVTAASATSITVKSADGYSSTYVINDATAVERDGAEGAPQIGDTVHVRAQVKDTAATAEDIHALSPEKAKELEEQRSAMEDWMAERPGGPASPGKA